MEEKPLGIMPRNVWERGRKIELLNAMTRYVEAGLSFPLEWAAELTALNREQSQEGKSLAKVVKQAQSEAIPLSCGSQSQNGIPDGLKTATLQSLLEDIIAAWERPRYGIQVLSVAREMEWRGPLDKAVVRAMQFLGSEGK